MTENKCVSCERKADTTSRLCSPCQVDDVVYETFCQKRSAGGAIRELASRPETMKLSEAVAVINRARRELLAECEAYTNEK